MIGVDLVALSIYLAVQSTVVLAVGFRPHHCPVGITWTAVTALVMFVLTAGKAKIGRALNNPVFIAEGRVTMIDGILAGAVLLGLALNSFTGWCGLTPLPATSSSITWSAKLVRSSGHDFTITQSVGAITRRIFRDCDEFKLGRARSTGHCNSFSVNLRWSLPSKNLSRSSVHLRSDELEMVVGDQVEVRSLREILSQ